MKKILILLLLPILSFTQNCVPTLVATDTCMYGYARTWVEWQPLDSGCVIANVHRGTPYNTYSWSWGNQIKLIFLFIITIARVILLLVQKAFGWF